MSLPLDVIQANQNVTAIVTAALNRDSEGIESVFASLSHEEVWGTAVAMSAWAAQFLTMWAAAYGLDPREFLVSFGADLAQEAG